MSHHHTTRSTTSARFALALALAAGAFFPGCATQPGIRDAARTGPFFTPTNHIGDPSLGGIRRVVVLPLWVGPETPTESAEQLDPVFLTELQKQNRFEIVTLSRAECRVRFRTEALMSSSALPHDLLGIFQREFAADAVLFVDLTVFHAYKPLALGLRAKLVTTQQPKLIWSFDNVFSADDPAVANSARHHFIDRDRSVPGADLTSAVFVSPARFAEYAASAMFTTLPPVVPPVVVAAKK
jgi:hypothetical protein